MTDTPEVAVLNLYETFNTDRESEEDGRWFELNPKTGFKIRAFSAKAVVDLREKLGKPYQQLVRAGLKIPEDKNEELTLRVIAGSVLADWKGVTDKSGAEMPFNAESAYTLFKDLPKLAGWIAGISTEADNYREQLREDGAKN